MYYISLARNGAEIVLMDGFKGEDLKGLYDQPLIHAAAAILTRANSHFKHGISICTYAQGITGRPLLHLPSLTE